MNKLVIIIPLLLFSLFFFGCLESNIPGIPYSTPQFIARTTDLNYSDFVSGGYSGECLRVDGNLITTGSCSDANADLNWSSIINFPVECPLGSAVQIVGTTLTCINIPIDTNYETAGYSFGDYVSYTGATTNVDLGDFNISANSFFGDGSNLTGISFTDTNFETAGYDFGDYFKLNQSTPQSIINGSPIFEEGSKVKCSTVDTDTLIVSGAGSNEVNLTYNLTYESGTYKEYSDPTYSYFLYYDTDYGGYGVILDTSNYDEWYYSSGGTNPTNTTWFIGFMGSDPVPTVNYETITTYLNINCTSVTSWNTAYSWGNHALEGYVTASGSVANADTVDLIHASNTPTANYLLPLDASGMLGLTKTSPTSYLKDNVSGYSTTLSKVNTNSEAKRENTINLTSPTPYALSLDGTINAQLTTPWSISSATRTLFNFWIKDWNTDGGDIYLYENSDSSEALYITNVAGQDKLKWKFGGGIVSKDINVDGEWHAISTQASVSGSSTFKIWWDNVLITYLSGYTTTSSVNFLFSKNNGDNKFVGEVDEIAFRHYSIRYNHHELFYNNGLGDYDFIADNKWHFDEASGTSAEDSVSTNDLTFSSSPTRVSSTQAINIFEKNLLVWKSIDTMQTFGDNSLLTTIDGSSINLKENTYLLDNKKLFLGTLQDSSFIYNGSNLLINPKEVGSGYLNIQGNTLIDEDLNVTGNIWIDSNTQIKNDNNIIMTSPNGNKWNCGVNDSGVFSCS